MEPGSARTIGPISQGFVAQLLLMLDARFPLSHSCAIVQPNRFMTNLIRNPLRFIALLVLSCNFCFAQPSGQFSLPFDPSTTPLIDMNGTFSVTDQIVGAADQPINLSYSIHLIHSGNGALHGVPGDAALVQIGDADLLAAVATVPLPCFSLSVCAARDRSLEWKPFSILRSRTN